MTQKKELGRYKIWLYAGTSAMNFWYLDGENPEADADNQQERLQEFGSYQACMQIRREPYYDRLKRLKRVSLYYFVVGFVDGEASFSVSFTRQPYKHYPKGWRWVIHPRFQVYQHENHLDILELIKNEVFATGRLHRKTSPYSVYIYSVENLRTLHEKIIPFFTKYQLATKAEDFTKFADIVKRLMNKEHLTYIGFKKIVDIAFTMNAQGKQRKHSKQYILGTLIDQFPTLINS